MKPELKPIDAQVIVITGASSGIGRATAEAAAERGAKLVLAARSAEALWGIAQRLSAGGAEAIAVEGDVSEREDVERVARAPLDRFGRIDCWVNNAGISIYGRLDEVGAMAKVNTSVAKMMPRMRDKLAAKQAGRQQYDEPPRNRAGALFRPSQTTGVVAQTHGAGGREPA